MGAAALLVLWLVGSWVGVVGATSDQVNVFVGTSGEGYGTAGLNPGAQVPLGVVRVGPDTCKLLDVALPWHTGGYHFSDSHIRCFAHTHMVGAGVRDNSNLAFMPTNKEIVKALVTNHGYRSTFQHNSEVARPGYYAVTLDEPGTRVELTAGFFTAFHRYSFPVTAPARVVIDLGYSLPAGTVKDASVAVNVTEGEISGWLINHGDLSGRFGGVKLFFSARFHVPQSPSSTTPFNLFGVFNDGNVMVLGQSTTGPRVGAFVGFPPSVESTIVVEARVGMSLVSIEKARENRGTIDPKSFDEVVQEADTRWNSVLELVDVEGGSSEDRTAFFSFLYNVFMSPSNLTEPAGRVFLGFDKTVHEANGWNFLSDMSLWDTHRTAAPLQGLLTPHIQRDVVKSLIAMKDQGGDLPRWPFWYGYTGCMLGTHADIVLVDAFLKGERDFDADALFDSMKLQATTSRPHGRGHVEEYMQQGYVSADSTRKGTSETLEYAQDDGALALMAEALGRVDDAAAFRKRALNYRNVWDPSEKFFCPRQRDGTFACPKYKDDLIGIFKSTDFVEGDAWQWRWYVPHDPEGLVSLFGGPDVFVRELETFFEKSLAFPGTLLPNPFFWAGNEPDLLAPYLFNIAGRSDLTQKWTRHILRTYYGNRPDGIPGNDDYGTMSAWFVFTAFGIYPLAGSTRFLLGSPIFPHVTLHLPGGDFHIMAHGVSEKNFYVERVLLNGSALTKPEIDFQSIASGGSLEFFMTCTPSNAFE